MQVKHQNQQYDDARRNSLIQQILYYFKRTLSYKNLEKEVKHIYTTLDRSQLLFITSQTPNKQCLKELERRKKSKIETSSQYKMQDYKRKVSSSKKIKIYELQKKLNRLIMDHNSKLSQFNSYKRPLESDQQTIQQLNQIINKQNIRLRELINQDQEYLGLICLKESEESLAREELQKVISKRQSYEYEKMSIILRISNLNKRIRQLKGSTLYVQMQPELEFKQRYQDPFFTVNLGLLQNLEIQKSSEISYEEEIQESNNEQESQESNEQKQKSSQNQRDIIESNHFNRQTNNYIQSTRHYMRNQLKNKLTPIIQNSDQKIQFQQGNIEPQEVYYDIIDSNTQLPYLFNSSNSYLISKNKYPTFSSNRPQKIQKYQFKVYPYQQKLEKSKLQKYPSNQSQKQQKNECKIPNIDFLNCKISSLLRDKVQISESVNCHLNSQSYQLKQQIILIETEIKHHNTSLNLIQMKIKLKNQFIQREIIKNVNHLEKIEEIRPQLSQKEGQRGQMRGRIGTKVEQAGVLKVLKVTIQRDLQKLNEKVNNLIAYRKMLCGQMIQGK